ncbi:MAG: two-component system sensor histidine kinase CreC, partial [Betaproteobacteria bacterium]
MRIGLRLLLAFLLVLGLGLVVVLQVFLEEVKPGTRMAMEDSLVDTAYTLAQLAAPELKAGTLATGAFAQALRALPDVRPQATLWGFPKERIDTQVSVTDARGVVVFDTRPGFIGRDHSRWNDVLRTLRGEYGARSSATAPDRPDDTVMHVAAPIRDEGRIIGVLTVSRPNRTLEPYIDRGRQRVLAASWVLLGVTLAVGGLLTWWIASSLQRLQAYALAVARGDRAVPPRMGRFSGNTEFHDLAQAVERMRLRLEDKGYVEHYVHTLTHELKSPLAALRGAAEVLQEPLPEPERQRFAAHVQRQTERLQQLIDRLLGLAAVEQLRQLHDAEVLDVAALTRERLAAQEPRLRRKGLQVQAALDDTLRVQGSRFLLSQALHNLLDNAIDFSPPGGTLHIAWHRAADHPREATWSVRDEGPGVPDYALPRVFERFYSLPRQDTQERSSGLGLCFVREVCELHQGRVSVDNVPAGDAAAVPAGCRASLTLPLHDAG